jgi:hypothetical protein
MSKLISKIEDLQMKTTSKAVMEACNNALRPLRRFNTVGGNDDTSVLESDVFKDLIEALSSIDDVAAKEFISTNALESRIAALNDLGVSSSIKALSESEIAGHPAFSYVFSRIKSNTAGKPEWMVIEGMISVLSPFNWDTTVNNCLQTLSENFDKYKEEISIFNIIESLKTSTSNYLYAGISGLVDSYINNRTSADRVKLMEKVSQYMFDPHMKTLYGFLAERDRAFHLNVTDNTCTVNRVYSPVVISESAEFFTVGGSVFKKEDNIILLANETEVNNLPTGFSALSEILSWENVSVSEGLIKIYAGDKKIEIFENEGKPAVKINGHLTETKDINRIYLNAGVFKMNEKQAINAIYTIVENWNNLFELDFAKSIKSKSEPYKQATMFMLGENIFVMKKNSQLNENVFYKNCNATQTRNLLMEFMKFDVTSTFSEFLNEESKQVSQVNELRKEYLQAIDLLTKKKEMLENMNAEIRENSELKDLIEAIQEEIGLLKEEYSKLSTTVTKATHIDEGLGVAVGDEASVGKKK